MGGILKKSKDDSQFHNMYNVEKHGGSGGVSDYVMKVTKVYSRDATKREVSEGCSTYSKRPGCSHQQTRRVTAGYISTLSVESVIVETLGGCQHPVTSRLHRRGTVYAQKLAPTAMGY